MALSHAISLLIRWMKSSLLGTRSLNFNPISLVFSCLAWQCLTWLMWPWSWQREIMSCVDGLLHIIRCGFVIDSFVNSHTLPPPLTFLPVILSFSFFVGYCVILSGSFAVKCTPVVYALVFWEQKSREVHKFLLMLKHSVCVGLTVSRRCSGLTFIESP